ncbi:MAG: hypothetical protein NC818_04345 [Candidatus Omnitrophica bacterium]|nr:hypothetical protein [Candidatus Omnitrophota bacterium]
MSNKSGQVFIIVVSLVFLLTAAIETSVLLYMRNHHRLTLKQATLTEALYYASAGVERAIYQLKIDKDDGIEDYWGEVYHIPGEEDVEININVFPHGFDTFRIVSSVSQEKAAREIMASRKIEAIVQRTESGSEEEFYSQVNLISWRELPAD